MEADSARNNVKVGSRHVSVSTESEIVEAACNGDVNSFGKLYERYYTAMVWLAYSILADRNLAEDVAQETFAVACSELIRLKQPEKFANWLAAICRNVACRMAKQRKKEVLINDPLVVSERSNDDGHEKAVREAISNLPTPYKEVLILRYYNDMNYEQIASILGICISKVKGRLFRARRKLGKYLKQKGVE